MAVIHVKWRNINTIYTGPTFDKKGQKCTLTCAAECAGNELFCAGKMSPEGCKEQDVCIEKGVGTDGNPCPGFCPVDCKGNEFSWPTPHDKNGCAVAPKCIPMKFDKFGNPCASQQGPVYCKETEITCVGMLNLGNFFRFGVSIDLEFWN